MWSDKAGGRVFLFVIAIALVSSSVAANAVVFERYDTTYTLKGDTLEVHKKLRLQNIGQNPIIPGEIHFKLSEQQAGEMVPAEIRNLRIIDHYSKDIDSKQIKGKRDLDIVFTIWDPLLPSFYYDFQMDYEITFDPKGLLFYEINIPTEKTTITIRNQDTRFLLPSRYHVTYAPDAVVESRDGARVIIWKDSQDLQFEYSFIPLPKIGVRMVNVFWITLIIISLMYLVFRFIRTRDRVEEY